MRAYIFISRIDSADEFRRNAVYIAQLTRSYKCANSKRRRPGRPVLTPRVSFFCTRSGRLYIIYMYSLLDLWLCYFLQQFGSNDLIRDKVKCIDVTKLILIYCKR